MSGAAFFDYDPVLRGYRFIVLTESEPKIEAFESHRHEEGWSSTYAAWELDGDVVTYTGHDDGVDCDGRLSRTSRYVCPVADLASREPYAADGETPPPFRLPEWTEGRRSQRDYAAESCGY